MTREKFIRILLLVALIAAAVLIHRFAPGWEVYLYRGVTLSENKGWIFPIIAAVLMAAYLFNLLWTLYGPGKKHQRGDDAMGLGCLFCAAIGIAIILLVFGVACLLQWFPLINLISFLTIFLAVLILPQYYWAKWQDRRKRRRQ